MSEPEKNDYMKWPSDSTFRRLFKGNNKNLGQRVMNENVYYKYIL